jgi:Hydrogenase 4 membrane component (E)
MSTDIVVSMNALSGVLFLLATFMMLTLRQVQAVLHAYVVQALLLTTSTILLAIGLHSPELALVALITLIAKPLLVPWLISRLLGEGLRAKREVQAVLNVPISLTIALGISVLAYLLTRPLLRGTDGIVQVNLPIGLDVLLLGMIMLAIRREALPQLMGLMVIDNGAFFAGIAITTSSALVEFAAALEGVMVVMIVALLTRTIAKFVGSTEVSALASLRERDVP